MDNRLQTIYDTLKQAQLYEHAARVLQFDMETICPPAGMEEQGSIAAELQTKAFALRKDPEFIQAAESLAQDPEGLDEMDRIMIGYLHEDNEKTKRITPEMNHAYALVYNRAFVKWLEAKNAADFSIFAPSLEEVRRVELEQIGLREKSLPCAYDHRLDDYESGMSTEMLDACFGECKERLVPLLSRIMNSKKKIRTDFLSRPVREEAQREMARYLLELLGFDFNRGNFTTSEHPFTEGVGRDDVRLTTHYYENMFSSSMYSIIHECGHALFELNQPSENHDHFLEHKTMGQHESVSRFYENRIGRSEAFVHLIYPKAKELFPEALGDVTERELYEALNVVQPSLVRTEADEFTYTFHIIIRYEIEKMILNGEVRTADLPAIWNAKYREYLGIEPANDREGILQDMHWTSGFGYFPSYALGNMYNAMYMNRMKKEIDVDGAVAAGNMKSVLDWMTENVFKTADREHPKDWIRNIAGEEFSPKAFLDYLEEKYTKLYELD